MSTGSNITPLGWGFEVLPASASTQGAGAEALGPRRQGQAAGARARLIRSAHESGVIWRRFRKQPYHTSAADPLWSCR